MCSVFDKSLLCIFLNLEIGTLSRLFLLCATHGLVYANHFDILYSFSVRGMLYPALMETLVSNEKSDENRCFEYRTSTNFCSFIILLQLLSSLWRPWFWCKITNDSDFYQIRILLLNPQKGEVTFSGGQEKKMSLLACFEVSHPSSTLCFSQKIISSGMQEKMAFHSYSPFSDILTLKVLINGENSAY